jgi:hypothetical protein
MRAKWIIPLAWMILVTAAHSEPDMISSTTTPKILSAFRGYALRRDYNCPVAKVVAHYPPDEYGDVFRLFCKTNPETDDVLDFRITITPKGNYIVRKW